MTMLNSIKQQIQNLNNLIKDIKDPMSVNNVNLKNNLQLLVNISTQRLNSAYVAMLSPAKLSNLHTYIQNIINSLASYKNSVVNKTNPAIQVLIQQQLSNIMPHYDAALNIIMLIPTLQQSEPEKVLDIAISEFRTKAEESIKYFNSTNEKFNNTIKDATQIIVATQQNIDDKKTELSNLTNTFRESFAKSENEISSKFKEKTDIELKSIIELKEKTEKIFELTGKSATEESQKIYADEAKSGAFWCFLIGLIWMVIILSLIFYPLLMHMWKDGGADIDWVSIAYRSVSGFILLLPSFYLLNESKKHRDVEREYRELQIKLAAIEPYFLHIHEGVSKEGQTIPDKDLVRLKIAESLLSPKKQIGKDDIVVPKGTIGAIEKIIEVVTTKITK